MPITLSSPAALTADEAAEVRDLAAEIETRDGQPPLNDHALTHLTSAAVRHLLARDDDRVVAYGQLDETSGEVAGSAAAEVLDHWGKAVETVWSHGARSSLIAVLEARPFTRTRVLHQLRRDTALPVPDAATPSGVTIRTFRTGDEAAWLATNSAAFAHHPEQGRLERADLDALLAESWFDPAGFFLAWRDEQLAGYHWTKIHPDGLGEVYVIGVDPSAQGLGLGTVLLNVGLAHLAAAGCPQVLLYVDESNTGAMRLYEGVGFTRHDADTQWMRS